MSEKLRQSKTINVHKDIYADLDAILDTRLGTLKVFFKDIYNKIMNDKNEYENRIIDSFYYLPNEIFEEYYKNRDMEILKHSKLSNSLFLLKLTISDLFDKRSLSDNRFKPIRLVINTYPYKLNESLLKMIRGAIKHHIETEGLVIEFINKSYEELTTEYVDNNFGILYMYKGLEWLNIRSLLKDMDINIPNTNLVCPALLSEPMIFTNPDDVVKYFTDLEKVFSYYINIDFNRVELFNYL